MHDERDWGRSGLVLCLLSKAIKLLLDLKVIKALFLLLLELALLLSVTYVGLEVLKLILGGSLTLLVVVDWLGNGFNRGISDGN